MFVPSIATATISHKNQTQVWGLHQWSDKKIYLCKQHSCGDWQTVAPATETEKEWFRQHGNVVPERDKG